MVICFNGVIPFNFLFLFGEWMPQVSNDEIIHPLPRYQGRQYQAYCDKNRKYQNPVKCAQQESGDYCNKQEENNVDDIWAQISPIDKKANSPQKNDRLPPKFYDLVYRPYPVWSRFWKLWNLNAHRLKHVFAANEENKVDQRIQ